MKVVGNAQVTRQGLAKLLNNEADLTVCGEADNAHDALEPIKSLQPDLAIVDIGLPGKSGFEFIKDLRTLAPQVLVLVMSMHDETVYAERILRAGGRGYFMKGEPPAKLLGAIRRVLGGNVYLSERMSARMLNQLAAPRSGAEESPLSRLTDREFEVFRLMGQGMTTQEISARLFVSTKTVDTHRLHIKKKLRLRSLPELVKFAVQWSGAGEPI